MVYHRAGRAPVFPDGLREKHAVIVAQRRHLMNHRLTVSRELRLSTVVMFVSILGLSIFMPVFTDEITWKFLNTRTFLDGFVNITLFPQCGEPFTTQTPWFMLPVRLIDAWVYSNISTPLQIRILGVITCIVWLGTLLLMLPRSLAIPLRGLPLVSTISAFLSLGVLPFMIVVNRPEQVILLFLTIVFLSPFVFSSLEAKASIAGLMVATLLAIIVLFSYHPKTLLFLPVMIANGYFLFKRPVIRVAYFAALAYFTAYTYFYWIQRNTCPDDIQYQSAMQTMLLPLSEILSNPIQSLKPLGLNIWRHLGLLNITIRKSYPSNLLPPNNDLTTPAYIVNSLIYVLLAIVSIVSIAAIIKLGIDAWKKRVVSKRVVMVASCLFSLISLFAVQGVSNFYEMTLIFPLLGIVVLVSLTPQLYRRDPTAARLLGQYLMCLALMSGGVLWYNFLPKFQNSLNADGYISEQPLSISAFNYDKIKTKIVETARMCHIDISTRPHHLVVDDLTYLAMIRAYQPFHILYVMRAGGSSLWGDGGRNIGRILSLLKERRSAGIIVGCHMLPQELRDGAVENSPFCCVPSFAP